MAASYSDDAMLEAAARADQLLEDGDLIAAANWYRILDAVERLQAKASAGGESEDSPPFVWRDYRLGLAIVEYGEAVASISIRISAIEYAITDPVALTSGFSEALPSSGLRCIGSGALRAIRHCLGRQELRGQCKKTGNQKCFAHRSLPQYVGCFTISRKVGSECDGAHILFQSIRCAERESLDAEAGADASLPPPAVLRLRYASSCFTACCALLARMERNRVSCRHHHCAAII